MDWRLKRSIQRILIVLLLGSGSCRQDEASEEVLLLPSEAEVVEVAGLTLDESASAEEVAWALLQVARKDVQAQSYAERREALRMECRLAHAALLEQIIAPMAERTAYSPENLALRVIRNWAPTLHYYVAYVADDFEDARAHMNSKAIAPPADGENLPEARVVAYRVKSAEDGGPESLKDGATLLFYLAKTPEGYWRIYKVDLGPARQVAAGP